MNNTGNGFKWIRLLCFIHLYNTFRSIISVYVWYKNYIQCLKNITNDGMVIWMNEMKFRGCVPGTVTSSHLISELYVMFGKLVLIVIVIDAVHAVMGALRLYRRFRARCESHLFRWAVLCPKYPRIAVMCWDSLYYLKCFGHRQVINKLNNYFMRDFIIHLCQTQTAV